ncbi:hypothetical protein K461DRAFT_270786 [Myriangium duriaei CBS 260.36]|uniref:Uncharacterized protein n=1 Tax=Myriangium duriaei CBS 260.36 TaxID=1168546 RepID=A0A9P4IXH6_9PEZI|nr:hypothetical protein K461DRAFT_270786 [Myriangium duriaei CBS 260.36]
MYLSKFIVYALAGLAALSTATSKSTTSVKSSEVTTRSSAAKPIAKQATTSPSSTLSLPAAVAILRSEVAHPSTFCNFYLSNGLTQSNSAIAGLSAKSLTQACQNVVPKVQKQTALKTSTAKTSCNKSALEAITKEFSSPSAFCKYWSSGTQKYIPLTTLTTLLQISDACQCLIASSSTSSASKSSTKSTTLKTNKTTSTTYRTTASPSGIGSMTRTTTLSKPSVGITRLSTTTVKPTATSTSASTSSTGFYLRLKQANDSQPLLGDDFGGYWVNALSFDMDNLNPGQYLAVTSEIPREPFVLGTNNDLMLMTGTMSGKPGAFYGYGGYMQPLGLYLNIAGTSSLTWTWNRAQNLMNISSTQAGWPDYHNNFITCRHEIDDANPYYTIWESWTRPAQPLYIGPDSTCDSWTMEVVPQSIVKTLATATSTTKSQSTGLITSTQDMTYSTPFYLKLAGTGAPASMNFNGYYLDFFNTITVTGNKYVYLGVTKTKPSTTYVLNQNNVLMQRTGTSWATPGFAVSQGIYSSYEFIYLRSYIPYEDMPLGWKYNSTSKTMSLSYGLSLLAMTCIPSADLFAFWNSTSMSAPPIITRNLVNDACFPWNITMESV